MTTILAARAENSLLTLNRVVSLLRGRQIEVVAITFARTDLPNVAALTVLVKGERVSSQRLISCLGKLDDVWDVAVVSDRSDTAVRELAVVEVKRTEYVESTINRMRSGLARLIRQTASTAFIELLGDVAELDAALDALRPLDIASVTRVGPIVAQTLSCSG